MQATDWEQEQKWKLVVEEVRARAHFRVGNYDLAEDLSGYILEHLLLIARRKPNWDILSNTRLRKRIETRKMLDWFRQHAMLMRRYQPLLVQSDETGEEYEAAFGTAIELSFNDEQFEVIERRDLAEVANREIRKVIGRRGAQLLDAVIANDTLDPQELALARETRPATINSQMYVTRHKSNLLEKKDFDF